MKVTNRDLFEIEKVLASFDDSKAVALSWAATRNQAIISPAIADIRKMLAPTESIKSLQAGIQKLAEKYADKKEDGTPVTEVSEDRIVYRLSDPEAYVQAVEELRHSEEHAQALEDEEFLLKKERELLEEEFTFEPYVLKVGRLKDGDMSQAQMKVLYKAGILED